jgi:hypothetical protein
MANDKDFLLKNAVEVGGPTKVTLGTVTANNVDLSTGNYFADTPSGTSTYTFSNAGDVQSFQIEVTGGTAEVAQNFSTTLYTGTGTTQTITNGIDLAGDGGLVWLKSRSAATNNYVYDTERGVGQRLITNTTSSQFNATDSLTAFNSDGFSLGADTIAGQVNISGNTYVSWTFKKEPSFFDVVTWTGDGVSTGRAISHNLGVVPGMVIVKCTSTSEQWVIKHKDAGNLFFTTAAANSGNDPVFWGDGTSYIAPTDSVFTVGHFGNFVNASGQTYVAYLFAHDDAADGLIQCGSYTGTGSAGLAINIGWEPQWFMMKRTDTAGADWFIFDSQRDFSVSPQKILRANAADAEGTTTAFLPTATGVELLGTFSSVNASGGNYIYIAIRAASDPDITWPASVEWTGGTAPSSPAVGETDVYTFVTDDGGTSYVGIQSADNIS